MHRFHTTCISAALGLMLASTFAVAQPAPANKRLPTQDKAMPNAQQQTANALSNFKWDLQRVVAGPNRAGAMRLPKQGLLPQLQFVPEQSSQQGRLVVSNLCNVVSGSYWTRGNTLRATQFISTKRACLDDNQMRLEAAVGTQLPLLSSYNIQTRGNQTSLELHFSDGSRWQLVGALTHEARYGGEAQRVFIEIAPDKRSDCKPNTLCLKARELSYNEQGLKTYTGNWQPFTDRIEGFTPEAGMRNVLRLKRYAAPNSAKPVDVLDMVVESELMN